MEQRSWQKTLPCIVGALNLLGFWVFYLRLPNRTENTLMKQLFFNSVATVLMALGLVGSTADNLACWKPWPHSKPNSGAAR